MMINKLTLSIDYNKWLKRLDTELNESTNQYSIKIPKVVKATNKKTLNKTFGIKVINQPMSLSSMVVGTCIYMQVHVFTCKSHVNLHLS